MKKIRIIFIVFLLIFLAGVFGFAKYISDSLVDQDLNTTDRNYQQTSL